MSLERQEFWAGLNDAIAERRDSPLSPTQRDDSENDNYRPVGELPASVGYSFNVRLDGQIMVYIIPKDRDSREEVFSFLRSRKAQIDNAFDGELEWRPEDQSTKLVIRREADIQENREAWEKYQDWLIQKAEKVDEVFRTHLLEFEAG